MKTKKKLLTLVLSSVMVLSLAVGGGTYALFTASAQNTGSTFKSGTLEISSHRHDVPVEGPMFYTNDGDAGQMGTGFWAPGDSHTRAMLIKNKGSLDGKLTVLSAIPEGDAANALAFGNQAMVTVATLTTSNGEPLDARGIEAINRIIDEKFKDLMQGSIWKQAIARGIQAAFALTNEVFLDSQYQVNSDGESVRVRVADLYVGLLSDLYNNGNGKPSAIRNFILPAHGMMHLAYNVTLLDDAAHTFTNNDLQGQTVNFTFQNTFEQVKNNNGPVIP
jgi:spore coat-associated protein N